MSAWLYTYLTRGLVLDLLSWLAYVNGMPKHQTEYCDTNKCCTSSRDYHVEAIEGNVCEYILFSNCARD